MDYWNRHSFGKVQKQLHKAKQHMVMLHERGYLGANREEHELARDEVQKWLEGDEIMWRQRSKVLWLKEGDQNSKYFHMKASQRRRKNKLVKLQDDNEFWHESERRDRVIIDYFKNLFTSSNSRGSLDFLEPLSSRVTSQMNGDLSMAYSEDEVKAALQQMNPTNAPGPDGMSPIFFQKYWHVVGELVTSAALDALNSSYFPASLNHTYITLIPKKKSHSKVCDYRPISLCNVVYKLIAKVISNRLKNWLVNHRYCSNCL